MSRFDYVKYDQGAVEDQAHAKKLVGQLESLINAIGYALGSNEERKSCGRAKSLALTKLEESYMWIGKAIRDDQIERTKQTVFQEERSNS